MLLVAYLSILMHSLSLFLSRRDMPWYLYYPNKAFSFVLATLQKTPKSGAYTSVFCAVMDDKLAPAVDAHYFVNSELQALEQWMLNDEDAKQLWELSSKLVSIPVGLVVRGSSLSVPQSTGEMNE